jgi:hypothetical protein
MVEKLEKNDTIVKPVIRYTNIEGFQEALKEFSRNALEYVFGNEMEVEQDLIGINSIIGVENSPIISQIDTRLGPWIGNGEYRIDLETSLKTHLNYNNEEWKNLFGYGFGKEAGNKITNIDMIDENHLLFTKELYGDITRRKKFENLDKLTRKLIESQGFINESITNLYQNIGIQNPELKTYGIDLSKFGE